MTAQEVQALRADNDRLRAELETLTAALIRWHRADGHEDFCDVDQDLADIAAALARGEDGVE